MNRINGKRNLMKYGRNIMRKLKMIGLSTLLIACTHAQAGLWPVPVPDPIEFKQIGLLLKQLQQLKKQVDQYDQQIRGVNNVVNGVTNLKSSLEAQTKEYKQMMSGNFGYSRMYDKGVLNRWEGISRSWDSMVYKNRRANDSVSRLMNNIESRFKSLKTESNKLGFSDKEQQELFQETNKTVVASRAVTEQSYNDIDKDIEMLEKLKSEIGKNKEAKATIDLNARINAQAAIIQAKEARIKAAQTQLQAISMQHEASDKVWANKFIDWE